MKAVITGDIINSRGGRVEDWINSLKDTLMKYGEEPKTWELYRGDSFQLSLAPENSFIAALHIKATIRKLKGYDVRMAIGIGEETYSSSKIRESNGTAYVNSGECFDQLKKSSLAVKTDISDLNETLNIMIRLALLAADNWTQVVSEVIKTAIEHPEKNQVDLAKALDKSQSNISEAFKRGGFEEIMSLNDYFVKKIGQL